MMDATRIIQQGETAKFKVAIADFDMDANNFKVELIYGYRRTVVEIPKSKMLVNGSDYYFVFDTDGMVGRVKARCTWYVPDSDVSGDRERVDEQFLCFIVTTPCPQFFTCPACAISTTVTYTRTNQSDIADEYERLCDYYGRPIKTRDDEYIYVHKNS